MRWAVVGWLLVGLGGVAVADEPVREEGVPGYCAWVRGVGDAQGALLRAPSVFANVGMVNAGEAGGDRGVPLGGPTPRLTAGLEYDFLGPSRAGALRRRADAECERYQALASLRATLRQRGDVGARAAWDARAQVLETALPEAERLLTSLREEMAQGRATLEELNALELRVDGLRTLAHETARERARLSTLPSLAEPALATWLEALRTAEARVETESAGLRRAEAWTVRVRGGYDELVRVRQDVPLFGALTVSYNFGALWQAPANARAQAGRQRALEEDVDGVSQDVALLLRELRAAQAVEATRLREVSLLVADLEAQLGEVRELETARLRRYHGYLVLELMRLRAERAWLEAHVAAVGAFLEAQR